MSLIAKREGGSSVPRLEPGTYQAVCCGVIDLGRQYSEKWEKTQSKVLIMWDIVGETVEIDGKTEPRKLSKQYTNSLSEKASLLKDVNSWRGKPFTDEELKSFDLTKLLGAGCQLSIIHETKNEHTYVNISAIVGLPKGVKLSPMSDPVIYDADNHDESVFVALPEWVQNIIKNSEQWQAAHTAENMPEEEIKPFGNDFGGDDDLPF